MMDVLLTFTGFHDPYFKGLVDQEEQPGPILSLLTSRSFGHIFLFDTPSTQRVTAETKDVITKLHSGSVVHVLEVNLSDPTNYQEIFKGLKNHIHRIIDLQGSGTGQVNCLKINLNFKKEQPKNHLY